jgi:ribosomal protein L11 methyltransferase
MADQLAFDTTPVEAVSETYQVVLANIEARTLAALAPAIVSRVRAGGIVVLAGVLGEQKNAVTGAYRELLVEDEAAEDEWVTLVLRRQA